MQDKTSEPDRAEVIKAKLDEWRKKSRIQIASWPRGQRPKYWRSPLGKRLREAIKASGKSMIRVAAETSIPYSTLRRWGKQGRIPAEVIPYLARYLNVDSAFLLGETTELQSDAEAMKDECIRILAGALADLNERYKRILKA